MKRLFLFIPFLAVSALFSCGKVKGPADSNSIQLNNSLDSTVTMSCAINGDLWSTDSAFGSVTKPSGNDSTVQNLIITATRHSGGSPTTIEFNINRYTGPNVYTINPPYTTAAYYVGNTRHFATSGKITINAATTTLYALRGSFDFKADSYFIDNGVFDVANP